MITIKLSGNEPDAVLALMQVGLRSLQGPDFDSLVGSYVTVRDKVIDAKASPVAGVAAVPNGDPNLYPDVVPANDQPSDGAKRS